MKHKLTFQIKARVSCLQCIFALTQNDINIYVEVVDQSAATGPIGVSSVQLASDIPIPNGSSFVISEAGKTILEALDQVTIYGICWKAGRSRSCGYISGQYVTSFRSGRQAL